MEQVALTLEQQEQNRQDRLAEAESPCPKCGRLRVKRSAYVRLRDGVNWLAWRAINDWAKGYNEAIDNVRRMFFVPEPEAPEEIRDLFAATEGIALGSGKQHNAAVIEAYRRGREGR